MSNGLKRRYYILTILNKVKRYFRIAYMSVFLRSYYEPKLRLSRALWSMVKKVNNKESAMLWMLVINGSCTNEQCINATFDFLKSLPAFGDDSHVLAFMDIHLLDEFDFDDTHPDDIPAHFTLNW